MGRRPLGTLGTPGGFQPDAAGARIRLRERDAAVAKRTSRASTAAVLAAVGLTMLALPWPRAAAQRLWDRLSLGRVEVVQISRNDLPESVAAVSTHGGPKSADAGSCPGCGGRRASRRISSLAASAGRIKKERRAQSVGRPIGGVYHAAVANRRHRARACRRGRLGHHGAEGMGRDDADRGRRSAGRGGVSGREAGSDAVPSVQDEHAAGIPVRSVHGDRLPGVRKERPRRPDAGQGNRRQPGSRDALSRAPPGSRSLAPVRPA